MRIKDFEKCIKHLSQEEILTGSISSLNELLVQKGIVSRRELQEAFLSWMRQTKKLPLKYMTLAELAQLEDKYTATLGSGCYSHSLRKKKPRE